MSADLNPLAHDTLLAAPAPGGAEFRSISDEGRPTIITTGAVAPIQRSNELAFVDTATPDYERLIAVMRESALAQGRNLDVVLIDSKSDGIRAITDALAQRNDLTAVHVVSHASDGTVQLGATQLDFVTLAAHSSSIKRWGNSLGANADILFYGCDLAASAEGKSLMTAVARLTGADVAASEDLTGSADKGGDWDLEFKTGAIEANVLVVDDVDDIWDGLLNTYIVTNGGDGGGPDTLRQAILNANANAGPDSIVFNISSGGGAVKTIDLNSALPTITGTVTIDGTSQPGYTGTPLIELDGQNAGGAALLNLGSSSGGSIIRGLIINRFGGAGIQISTGSDGNTIAGNWIGTDSAGNVTGSPGNANGIVIQGRNNIIGGTLTGDRNVISGNNVDEIQITAQGTGNQILGNYIGTNAAGTLAATTPGSTGINVLGTGNSIGGSAGGAGNLISGNSTGVLVANTNNLIEGNFIGTDATGTADVGNLSDGVRLQANNNTVTNNLISGNDSDGIEINAAASGNTIQGNVIGARAGGTVALPNSGNGILVTGGSNNNTIGGQVELTPGAGNTIVFNTRDGVSVLGGTGNRILGNSIYANGTLAGDLGIDLDSNGVTLNDVAPFDLDGGSNTLQNFPVLSTAITNGAQLQVSGALSSASLRNYRIEFFASAAADTSFYGEGQRYLGFRDVTTDNTGTVSFNFVLNAVVGVGEFISATATDSTTGDTSEFAQDAFASPAFEIRGTVYRDANGDATVSAPEGVFANANVRLYLDNGNGVIDGTDSLLASATTDAAGAYVFSNLLNATYWVVVDSRTLDAGSYLVGGINDVWAEQTYGTLGAVTYTGSYNYAAGAGALYGGMEATGASSSDNAAALTTAEHVTRVIVAGASAAGVDSGFSFSVVTNARDGDDDAVNPSRSVQGGLRQFIQNSNTLPGVQSVEFAIGAAGSTQTINVTGSALPTITDAVVLNAWTQGTAGYSGTPLVDIQGASAGAGAHGLTITAGGSTVRGFVIRDFAARGIYITGGGGNTVAGNYIGTDLAGSLDRGNGLSGVFIENSAGNTIGGLTATDRNVISGNQTDGISINGAGSTGNLVVGNYLGLNAAGTLALGNSESGIDIDTGASGNTVGGIVAGARNVISGNALSGIDISDAGTNGNVVLGNYIGTDAGGTLDRGNSGEGVRVFGSALGTTIGGSAAGAGNLISGNNSGGVSLASSGSIVQGNRIGTNTAGTGPLGNTTSGVVVTGSGNTIGGTAAGAGNLLSGNTENGVLFIGAGASGNVVLGNTMGLNAAGSGTIANGLSGVMLMNGAGGNTIGGTAAGARNVLSGNTQDGITGFASNGNLIQGNYIGTDAGGTLDRGNAEDGIYLEDGSNNVIGGSAPGAGNVLSGNTWTGVTLWGTGSGNVVQGNYVGTNTAGTLNLGNNQAGVWVATSGPATVGGTASGAGNLIAYNGWDGVMLTAGTGHSVLGNTIHSNVEQSIDIDDNGSVPFDGVEANDYDPTPGVAPYTHDSDGGVNQHQNFPVLASVVTTGTQVSIIGSLRSTSSTSFRVEFFANAAADGEAGRYLGFANVTTDVTGSALVSSTFAATLAVGEFVTATATRADATFTTFFETSEVGASVVAGTPRSISGMTLNDMNGNGTVADDGGAYLTGANVKLYLDDGDGVVDSGDVFQGATTVQLDGTYTFGGLAEGTYYVAIDSKTLIPSTEVWAEQTYGVAGAAKGGTFLGTAGALYGGRDAAVSDDFSALVTSEHVTRVTVAGANATGVNAGFSFVAITSNRDGDDDLGSNRTVQGSLRQFIQNSNLIGGTQSANFSIGGGGLQTIALASALPDIAGTVVLDAGTQETFTGTPLIELNGAGAGVNADGFHITASGSTVRGFLINRFNSDGIEITGGGNTIAGNWIGLDATGNVAPNGEQGIDVSGANNTIGGPAAADRNVISGNSSHGVMLAGGGASGNQVLGNYIGTDPTGALNRGNADGIRIQNGANGNTIGGAAANVISGNQDGIEIKDAGSSSNVVTGNYIGTRAGGGGALANSQSGVEVSASSNTIGGTAAGAGNVIAFNGEDGVMVTDNTTLGVAIWGNTIYSNTGIGIDLEGSNGPTPNDAGDADTGPNALQNYPVLTGAATNGATVTIAGSLDSTASTNYRIEFFANGVGGPRYLGATTPFFIGAAGSATLSVSLTTPVAVGEIITATATNLANNSTSEIGPGVAATTGVAISGTLFHDVNGNANIADDSGAVFANVVNAVALYLDDGDSVIDSGDSFVSAVSTNAAGAYTFNGLASGTYYVVVNSRTLGASAYNATFGQADVWAEQTYAVTGAAIGGGFTLTSGALYGGRDAGVSDNAAGAITTAEHVTKVTLAGSNVNGINSAFSFNAIVNARGDNTDDDTSNARRQQGSLRQFILNANAIDGPQTANFSIGGGGPQIINVSGAALPTITQAVILDAAATQEGSTGAPIIELNGAAVSGSDGLTITGGGSTVRGFAINRFDEGIVLSGVGGNVIANDYLGTDLTGTIDRGNQYGIRIASSNNLIGGFNAADRNVISGNAVDGINASGSNNTIAGNWIGVDASGTVGMRNDEDGIWLNAGSGNTVGGTAAGARNIIAANGWSGVALSGGGSGHVIQANWIGLDAGGAALGNVRNGVRIYDGVGAQVGGTAAGTGNVIANNGTGGAGFAGVAIDSGLGHSVLGNLIYNNSGLGIDLGNNGATPNDAPAALDADSGANNLQNFPVLTAVSQTSVSGTLNSGASRQYRIELFASPTSDGEGQRFLGATTVATNASGAVNFTVGVAAALGEWVTATATETPGSGDTSEFSAAVQVNSAPVNNVPGPQSVNEDSSLALNTISVSDFENNVSSVVLAVLNGTLAATPAGGALVAGGGTANVTITGGQAAINSTLASLVYQGTLNYSGPDTLTMTSTDAAGMQDVDTVTITVNPVDDVPQIDDATAPALPENSANGTAVFNVNEAFTGTDSDRDGQPLAYSITAGNTGGAFAINAATGAITVANSAALDFETTPVFSLTVRATDGTTPDTAVITVNLTNLNDNAPQINDATAPALPENSANGTAVYDVNEAFTGTDNDRDGQALAYSITGGNTGGAFAINAATGAITVANPAALDFETTPVFNLTVNTTDGTFSDIALITVNLTNLNDNVPQINDATAPALPENTANATVVYDVNEAFTGTDNDRDGQPLTYSITAGNTGGAFAIDVATGAIKVANSAALDFETTPVFNLTVQATDGTTPDTAVITINLTNLNDNVPQIDDAATSLAENSALGTPVYNVNEAFTGTDDDRDGQPLAYSITAGNTGGTFVINAATGAITVANSAALDFETTPVFNLTVQATDGATSDTAVITVNLINLNDNVPQIDDASTSLAENSALGTPVYNVNEAFTGTDNDRDGQALTYSITAGNTGGAFAINAATGAITVANPTALDFETTPVFNLTVQATDGTTPDTAVITVNLINLNDNVPQIDDATTSLAENSAFGAPVYNVNEAFTGTDADRDGQALAYSITAGNTGGAFAIDPATGAITVANSAALDFETTPVFNLTVQATDGATPDTAIITVNLTNLNDNAPQIDDAATSLAENSALGTPVYNVNEAFTGTDADRDGQALAYSITAGNTGGAFAINAATGAITVANPAALDFEATPVFNLAVQATDGTTPDTAVITVNLINLNDNVPQIDDAVAPSLPENSVLGTPVYNVSEAFTGTDADRDGQALAYSITAGNTGGAFAINAATGAITVANPAALDFETTPVFNLTIVATDGATPDTAVITVNLINLNDNVPQIDDATAPALPENSPLGTPVYNVNEAFTGTDADRDGQVLAYSITAGNIGGVFAIDPATGAITVANPAALDFETTPVFNLTIQATDGTTPDTAVITVNLTNLNDNVPQIDDAVAPSLPENSVLGTPVYNVNEAFTGTDADRDGQALAYSIIGGNTGGAFAIDAVTGAITVANPAAVDFETTPVFNLTVQATDGTTPDTAVITVNLINAGDNVPQIDDAVAPSLPENSVLGTPVYNVNEAFTGTDADRDGESLTYSITAGNAGGAFAIDAATGAITVANPAALDFETTPVFNLTVQATDGSTPDTAVITVNLINLNDNVPQIDDATAPALPENSALGTAVYNVNETFTGTDADRDGQTLTYSITAGNTGGAFAIDPATGAITVANPAALDFETTPVFNLTVQATDGSTPDTAVITVNLINLNDNLPQIDDATTSLAENSPFGTVVYNVNEAFTGTDADRDGQALAYSIVAGNTGGAFAIDPVTGAITVASPVAVDFESNPVFTLTVDATDGGFNDTAQITVNLLNLNDNAPAVADVTTSLAENSAAGTVVVDLNEWSTGTDADLDGQALTYSITGGNVGGAFAIDPATGAITVANPAALDFETTPVFNLTIVTTDGTTPDTATVTVNLVNANDNVPQIDDATAPALPENSAFGTPVYNVNEAFTGTDADRDGQALAYSITAGNVGGAFAIDPATGAITVANPAALDFETTPVFNLTVSATDGTAIDTAVITVDLGNVNEPPVITANAGLTVNEGAGATITSAELAVADPDNGAAQLVYTVGSAPANGTLYLSGVPVGVGGTFTQDDLDNARVSYTHNDSETVADGFTFTVSDGAGGAIGSTTFSITVNPVNDLPLAAADAAATNENTPVTTVDVLLNDALGDQPAAIVAFDAVSAQGGAVALNVGNTFTYTPVAGFSGTDTFTYTLRDVDGETSTATVTVTVANVANDAPVNIVPGAQISAEDVALVFSTGNGNRIAVSDPDAGANPLQVTLAATNGTLTLAGTAGLTFVVGTGAGDVTMTFTGTAAAINAALDGMAFLPPLDYDGPASVTITTNDLGSTGAGGPQSDSDTVDITVAVVNDAPTLDLDANNSSGALGADYRSTFTEGGLPVGIADLDATLADIDSANLAALTVTITNLLDGLNEVLSANTGGTLITATFVPGSGVLTLNGADTVANYQQVLRTVRYENLSDAPSPAQRVITFVASDGGSASNVGTTTVTIAAVNDAPTATFAAPSYTATENVTLNLHGTGISVADVDALPASIMTVQLSSISGLLGATASNGTTIAGVGSPTLTLIGTLAQINAVLAGTAGTVTYTVGSDSPAPTDTLDLSITDNGATGAGGAQWGFDSETVNLVAVNDAPIITIPGLASTPEDTALVFSTGGGNLISITDVDAAGFPVQVTINVSNGLLTLAGTTGLAFTVGDGAADASMAFTGTVAAINAALDGLSFMPTPDYSGPAFLSPSVNDQGNSGLGGALTDADFASITVIGVNDAPAGTDATVAMAPSTSYAFTAANFGFTDVDAGDTLNAVRIDAVPGAGSLTLGGIAVTAGQVIAVAAINGGNLVFTPAPAATGAPYASFAFSVQDSALAFDPSSNTITVNVAPIVNNPPSGTNGAVTTAPGVDYVFTLADFGYSDPDAGDLVSAVRFDTVPLLLEGTLYFGALALPAGTAVSAAGIAAGNLVFRPFLLFTGTASFDFSVRDTNGPAYDVVPNTMVVTVAVPTNDPVNVVPGPKVVNEDTALAVTGLAVNDPNGDLASVQLGVLNGTLNAAAAGTAALAGIGTATVTITGSQADINATLASVTYLGNLDFAGADILTITSTDATALQDVDNVAITINPVNDAPTAVAPPNYAAVEQSALTLTGLAVFDVDAGAANVTATLSAITGALFVAGGGGVTVVGSGTPLVTLTGNVGAINALLGGAGTVTYLVTSDSPPATDTLTLTINDGGATGAGGPRSATAVSTIAIGATNDAPVNTLPGGSTTLEDTPVVFSAAGGNQISVTDVDAGGAPLQITLNAANGVVTLGGTGGLAFGTGDGTADASMTFTGTLPAINAALNGLVFTPNLNYNGLAFITLATNDLGASGAGGALTDTDLATIDVLPVNDAPDGTDTTVTLNEDSTYTFGLGNFGFNDVDSGDAMTDVRIDSISLPAGATLQLGGVNVVPTQVITVADITAGLLVFTPVADANGAGYASFTFSVRDTGVPPGPLFDLAPNTMMVNVTPVNDLPAITSDGGGAAAALVVAENTTAVTTVTAADIDLQPLTFSLAGTDAARFSIDSVTGVLMFNPAPDFELPGDAGADNVYDIVVRVDDGAGGVDTQALTVTVVDGNDAPVATDDAYAVNEDSALPVALPGVLANDSDQDLNPLTATLVAGPANGSVVFNADGSFVYTPNANFNGVDTFTYQASDGALVSATATVTITVAPVNDAPSALDGTVYVFGPSYVFGEADFGYSDPDGDALDHITITALPIDGQLLLNGVAVALNQTVTAADLLAAKLVYVPPTPGAMVATTFGFLVHDATGAAVAGNTMTVGFAAGAAPPAPPAAPPASPPAPPAPPAAPALPPSGGGTGGGGGGGAPATSGGGRGGGGAGAPSGSAEGAAPTAADGAAAATVAGVAQATPPAPAVPTLGIAFQSGGLPTDPRAAAPTPPADQRGDPPVGEVKAEMEAVAAMAAPEVREELDKLRERTQDEVKIEARVAGSVFVVSSGLSVGYVLWLLRGGALIASLLSSLPAWRLVDPLPVLGSMGGRAGDEDDDSLEDLVADNGPPSAPGIDAMADDDNAGSVRT